MHCFKGNYLRSRGVRLLQQLVEVAHVIVAEDKLLGCAVSHPLDDGGMVASVRVDFTTFGWRGDTPTLPPLKKTKRDGGVSLPGSILARVNNVESLATKQEENSSAASLPCRSANSFSSSTWNLLVPEMFRVPPAPAPCFCKVSLQQKRC